MRHNSSMTMISNDSMTMISNNSMTMISNNSMTMISNNSMTMNYNNSSHTSHTKQAGAKMNSIKRLVNFLSKKSKENTMLLIRSIIL